MAYVQGDVIAASDYNDSVGTPTGTPSNSNKALQPFVSAVEATNTVAGIYGVGYGERGYGQTAQTLPNKSTGQTVTSAEWTALRAALEKCANHQGTAITNLVPATSLETGDTVFAHEGTDNPNDSLTDLISSIDTNRLNTDSGASMSLTSNVQTSTRATNWSGTITMTFRYQWSTADDARHFFNSGGELRVRLSQSPAIIAQDADWASVLSTGVGTYAFKAQTVTITGTQTASLTANTGFYDLTNSDTYTSSFNGVNIGSGAYAANDVLIDVRVPATGTGVLGSSNGGPGNTVDIRVTLQDQHSNANFDQVSAGTAAATDVYRATVELAGIAAPTTSVLVGF